MSDANLTLPQIPAREVQELEWSRISRLLHDQVGQVLSAIGLQLDLLRMDFKEHTPAIAERTEEIQHLLERAIVEVRDLSYEMDPMMMERTGLSAALDRLIGRFRKSFQGELQATLEHVHLPVAAATAIYRIAIQAIENAVKNAKGSRVRVRLKPTGKSIVLEVRDEGSGFAAEKGRQRAQVMAYYAAQANLDLSISSTEGRGTTVRIVFPALQPAGRVQLK